MQASHHTDVEIRGIEVLSFPSAELVKSKGGVNRHVGIGALSVLYFPDYNRFILYLNDFTYALLKRLPVVATSRANTQARSYIFPTYSGYYIIKLAKIEYQEAVENFETILRNNAMFSYEGESHLSRRDLSPHNDRFHDYEEESTGSFKERHSQVSSTNSSQSLSTKLSKRDKIKRSFGKVANAFKHRNWDQKHNVNLSRVADYNTLTHTGVDAHLAHDIHRKDVERTIIRSKDIAKKLGYLITPTGAIVGGSGVSRDPRFSGISASSASTQRTEGSTQMIPINATSVVTTQTTKQQTIQIIPIEEIEALIISEQKILAEIEQEKIAQAHERREQDEHKKLELYYIQKERELRDRARSVHSEVTTQQVLQREQVLLDEISRRDALIVEQARLREAERAEFERREQALVYEIERRLAELRQREALSEEERAEFRLREEELIAITQRRELEKSRAEARQAELLREAQDREAELRRREKLTEVERAEIERRDRQLEEELTVRLEELRRKSALTESERLEILNREEELRKLVELRNAEIVAIREGRVLAQRELDTRLANIFNREQLLEVERAEFEKRHHQLVAEAERRIAAFKNKQVLTEAERAELVYREEQLARLSAKKEAELAALTERQLLLNQQVFAREAELQNKIRLTNSERTELTRLRENYEKATELTEAERRGITYRLAELLEEAERRENDIALRQSLTEAERAELEKKEQQLEVEIQSRLYELRQKEKLTEAERTELHNRQKELRKITQIREVEIQQRSGSLEKLKETEAQLLAQNEALIRGHQQLSREILRVGETLDQAEQTVVTTTTTTTQHAVNTL